MQTQTQTEVSVNRILTAGQFVVGFAHDDNELAKEKARLLPLYGDSLQVSPVQVLAKPQGFGVSLPDLP
jgi:hypothetical protein